MYPQNPYQPGQVPQQPSADPIASQPPTLNHPGPSLPPNPGTYAQPVPQPTPYPQLPPLPQQPPQPGVQLPPAIDGPQQPVTQVRNDYSVDYLNQIAPPQRKTVNPLAMFGVIGGIITAAIIAVVLIVSSSSSTPSTQMQQALARISSLQTVSDAQQKHLAENDINQANATLGSALSSMKTDLTAIMKTQKVKAASKNAADTKSEAAYLTKLQKKLDDSYQRGTLDRTYTAQMTYELTLLKSKLKKLQNSSSSKSLTTFCTGAIANLDAILTAYANSVETE